MKDKVIGCRVTQELYDQLCEIGVPSNILRKALELYLNLNKKGCKRDVNTICFNCKHQTLCKIIDSHLDAKKGEN